MEIMDSGQQITVGNRPNDFHSFPDNWQVCSLGEITTSSQYGISSSSGGNYSVPILKMNNLQDGHIDLGDLDYIQLSKAEMKSLMLNKGNLLINRTNSPDLVGKAAIYDLAGEHVFASYLVRFRLGPSVLPAFVNYFLNSGPGQSKLKLLATKAVSQANINPSILKRLLFVPIPPLPEQQAIVAALSDVDALITSLDQLIAKKRDIKQATMQQLLTGKTRLPGFSGEWEVKKIGEIFQFLNTANNSRSDLSENGEIKYIHYGDIHMKWRSFLDCSSDELPSIQRDKVGNVPFLEDGDLVMADASEDYDGVGISVEVRNATSRKVVAGLHTFLLRGDKKALVDGFKGYLQYIPAVKDSLRKAATGISVYGVSKNNVRDISICLPDITEQTAIATVLSDMDAEIAALEQKRDKTRALKQGMMQELLTGKTRLL